MSDALRLPVQLLRRVRRSAWTLPLAAVAAMLLVTINEVGYAHSAHAIDRLGERAFARGQIQRVWRGLLDAETGQRGFLLTERPEYLTPYTRAAADVEETLAWLERYFDRDPEAGDVLARLRARSESKLSELATTLQMKASGREDAWRDLMLTDMGREHMDGVRALSQQLLDIETGRIADGRDGVYRLLHSSRLGIHLMTAISFLGLALFLRQTARFEESREEHALSLQAERDRLEVEVASRTADLTELARHLQTAREDEKSRLARELHDELGALLTAVKLDAARLKRVMGAPSPEALARLEHLNQTVNQGIELKRRIIEDLRPSSLSNLGLVSALEILLREHAERSELRVESDLHPVNLGESGEITVYRLVQEALTNTAKHAAAGRIHVCLQPAERQGVLGAQVRVADDGKGFDPAVRPGSAHGLMGMRYRVEAEGGAMQVRSQSLGGGTVIDAWIPSADRVVPAAPGLTPPEPSRGQALAGSPIAEAGGGLAPSRPLS